MLFIFYLSTNLNQINIFLTQWQTSKLTKETNVKSYKDKVLITLGVLFAMPWICFVVYTSFINRELSDYFTNLYLGYIMDYNSILNWPVRILMFLVIGIFDQLSMIFIPIFYYIISLIITAEFSKWNRCLEEDIPLGGLTFENNIIETYRLKYESLCQVVRKANNFLSFYIGFNLLANLSSICFLSYNIIMNWNKFSTALIYAILWTITILVLISGSSQINSQVT